VKGTVTVGLSADILFQTINTLTATTITSPQPNCPAAPNCGFGGGGGGCGSSSAAGFSITVPAGAAGGYAELAADGGVSMVTVISQQQVGPYESVVLKSDDGSALNNWLTAHGFDIPNDTKPVIAAYVSQGFDFLALKLVPGEGVQSMQPVRVTTQGAAPTLPLHMVSVGTGPVTGITIWIVADGRWQPSNFPTFTIAQSEISWDWATSSSNYETIRLSKEATYGGRGWQVESSLELSQYNISQTLESNIEYDPTGPAGGYLPPVPLLSDGGAPDAGHTGGSDAAPDAGATADASDEGDGAGEGYDAGEDYDAGGDDSDQQAAATADLAVLFYGISGPNVRITRMRSDVAKAALSVDMSLEASSDQSELSNQLTAQIEIGEPPCPVYNSSCVQTGTLPRSQAQAAAGGSPSGGCSTTRPSDGLGTTLAFILGAFGILVVRLRRTGAARTLTRRPAKRSSSG
jgi:hypothetical protein